MLENRALDATIAAYICYIYVVPLNPPQPSKTSYFKNSFEKQIVGKTSFPLTYSGLSYITDGLFICTFHFGMTLLMMYKAMPGSTD